ncbi:hypothetical protein [Aquimarina longa]|uniref:hypothetical protein n=1 Tax=Aquimarina longa TaxID=1080221 RepID=UPI000783C2E7|nr:hypothetical protein [Aquimarina longa]
MRKNNKIQELLIMVFEAEKKYYEAAEEVQIIALSRFLNYQSLERKKYVNELVEAFIFNNIKQETSCIDKSKEDQKGFEVKKPLEKSKYISIVCHCLDFDQNIIDKCVIMLRDNTIPVDILEVAVRLMTFLLFQGIECGQIIEELNIENNK